MSPGNDEGRPPGARETASNVEKTTNDTSIVRHMPDNVTTLQRYPTAFAARYRPNAERRCWWIAYRCPRCQRSHFGRSKTEITGGVRRARCGRLIWVVIARTYDSTGAAA